VCVPGWPSPGCVVPGAVPDGGGARGHLTGETLVPGRQTVVTRQPQPGGGPQTHGQSELFMLMFILSNTRF